MEAPAIGHYRMHSVNFNASEPKQERTKTPNSTGEHSSTPRDTRNRDAGTQKSRQENICKHSCHRQSLPFGTKQGASHYSVQRARTAREHPKAARAAREHPKHDEGTAQPLGHQASPAGRFQRRGRRTAREHPNTAPTTSWHLPKRGPAVTSTCWQCTLAYAQRNTKLSATPCTNHARGRSRRGNCTLDEVDAP